MKCLSVSQPFADLVVSGAKTVELRRWNTSFRGEFLVHAPLKVRTADCKRLGVSGRPVTGAIIGKAEIYGVREYKSGKEIAADSDLHHAGPGFERSRFGFMLKNPRRFRIPVPWKGRLGFFDAELPRHRTKEGELVSEIMDEEYRYQWIGHH